MSQLKILGLSFLGSLLVVPIWGLCLLSVEYASQYTSVLALLYSFYMPNLFPKLAQKKLQYALLLSFPLFYILLGFYFRQAFVFQMPIFVAFLVFVGALFLPKIKDLYSNESALVAR